MNNMHTIIYVMRHIDIGQHIDIPYKKVGITGLGNATLTKRLQQISNTKSPIKAQCIAAWEHEDAQKVESALHQLLEDSRVEGEWFLDKEDTLVERMQPIMELLGANSIEIEGADDSYTKQIIEKEGRNQAACNQTLLGEIDSLLDDPIMTDVRQRGPTFRSDKTKLTYYVNYRKSGKHAFRIGRSQDVYEDIEKLIEEHEFDLGKTSSGELRILGLSSSRIADLINIIESEFIIK